MQEKEAPTASPFCNIIVIITVIVITITKNCSSISSNNIIVDGRCSNN